MIILWHQGGPTACGMPALGVRRMPSKQELVADNVVLLSGKRPTRGDAIVCGSCHGLILDLDELRTDTSPVPFVGGVLAACR